MATSYGIEPHPQGFGGPYAPLHPEVAEKIVGIAPSCGCPHRPPHAMRPVCEPFWSRVFCGLCGWARTSGLRLPKPAAYQLTLHTDWNPLSWGWRGFRPQRVAIAAGAGDVSLVLHGPLVGATYVARLRTFSRPRLPGLQPPKEDSGKVGVGAQSRTGIAGFAIQSMAALPRPP